MDETRVGQVAAGAFAGMGVLALARPAAIPRMMGLAIVGDAGRNEVRAVYGGFGLAVAASLLAGDAASRRAARRSAGLSLLGMAAGRVADAAASRRLPVAGCAALVGETALGATLACAGRGSATSAG